MPITRAPLFEIPGEPAPPGGEVRFVGAHCGRGRVRVGHWPADATGRGTVVVFPGKSEFIEKYLEVVRALRARGFGAVVIDWRGQGLSLRETAHPIKAHINRFDDFLDDLDVVMREVVRPSAQEPVHLLAHSMGGTIALKAMGEGRIAPKTAILCAPMTGLKISVPFGVARAIARGACLLGKGTDYVPGGAQYDPLTAEFSTNALTHDEARYTALKQLIRAHPELAQGSPTFGWVDEAVRAILAVHDRKLLKRITCPVLVLSAEEDRIVESASHDRLVAALPDAQLFRVHGAAHEILQEREGIRQKVWARIDQLLLDRG